MTPTVTTPRRRDRAAQRAAAQRPTPPAPVVFETSGDARIAARVWTRHEWAALPRSARPACYGPTPDRRFVVALDVE